MLLRGGGAVLLGLAGAAAAPPFPRDVRAAVFQQVSVEVQTETGDPDEDEAPAENPPTYVRATGRVVASESDCLGTGARASGSTQGRGAECRRGAGARSRRRR
jgi:hypothetical protein